jgi:hypothetical protein
MTETNVSGEAEAGETWVTVAAFGPSAAEVFDEDLFHGPRFEDQGPAVRWHDRQKVRIEAASGDTLADLIDRASDAFGLSVPKRSPVDLYTPLSRVIDGVAFFKEADDLPGSYPGPFLRIFPCVDQDGQLAWREIQDAAYASVVRAYEHGLLLGDPQRIYLYPMVPQGGEVFFGSWPALLDAARAFLAAAEAISAIYGASQFVQAVANRLRAAKAIDFRALEKRNAGPAQVDELLRSHPWPTTELARLLGIPLDRVRELALVFGLDVCMDGQASVSTELDGRFQRRLIQFLLYNADTEHYPDRVEAFARARLEALAQGDNEPIVAWHRAWSYASVSEDVDMDGDAADAGGGASDEANLTVGFKVLAIPLDEGIDPDELEKRLNEAASAGDFMSMETLLDQPLKGGSRGHIVLLMRYGAET